METRKYFFGEDRNIPEELEATSYLAYVDLIEVTEENDYKEIEIRLDCIQIKDLSQNISQEFLLTLPSIVINLSLSIEIFNTYYSLSYLPYIEGRWLKLTTKKSKENLLQVNYFGVPLVNSGVAFDFITPIRRLTRGERAIYRNLLRLMNIRNLGRLATDEDFNQACVALQTFEHVSVYNVGQGNLNALCDNQNMPLLYFDMGGGEGQNAFTYPNMLRICTTNPPSVVLSHWDLDHIQTALLSNQSHTLTWFVPEQVLGLDHFILAYRIAQNGNLLRVTNSIVNNQFSILKCNGRLKNDSGIAILITQPNYTALLPGDASFIRIPNIGNLQFDGLIATHHGSKYGLTYYRNNIIPSANALNMLAFSYGQNNTHRHHPNNVIRLYRQKGWSVNHGHKETPNGSIIMKYCPVNHNVPCRGQRCDLITAQCY